MAAAPRGEAAVAGAGRVMVKPGLLDGAYSRPARMRAADRPGGQAGPAIHGRGVFPRAGRPRQLLRGRAATTPYGRLLEAAQAAQYDVERLQSRFGASFEQVCHRLSTMQRPGSPGIPFYFVKTDIAGNVLKRSSATRFQFARFGGPCPLWNVYRAFASPGQILVQLATTPDDVTYVNVARTVSRPGGFHLARPPFGRRRPRLRGAICDADRVCGGPRSQQPAGRGADRSGLPGLRENRVPPSRRAAGRARPGCGKRREGGHTVSHPRPAERTRRKVSSQRADLIAPPRLPVRGHGVPKGRDPG